jgi:UDP-glucose 4-epimerase
LDVCITGGAGFVGANAVRTLLSTPEIRRITVLDDLSTGVAAHLPDDGRVELIVGSILDPRLLDEALRGVNSVIHLAARPSVPRSLADPVATNHVNVDGTVAVLEAVRRHQVGHVIFASSSSVYGDSDRLPKRESDPPKPLSPYAASKLAAESYVLAYRASFGIKVLALRFFNVFGPYQSGAHDYAAVIPAFLDAAFNGRPLPVHGDGEQSRDFTYVETVAKVLRQAVMKESDHEGPVNLALGTRHTLRDVIAHLETIFGRPLQRAQLAARTADVKHSQADPSRLLALLPEVEPVTLQDGLRATVTWWQAQQARPVG